MTKTLSFVGRHVTASIVSIALPTIILIAGYITLLLIAILTNSGPGGPLALPFGIIFVVLASSLYTTFGLFPAVACSELASRRFAKLRYPLQILLSVLFLALIIVVWVLIWMLVDVDNTIVLGSKIAVVAFLALLIPLGIYWWSAKTAQAIIGLVKNVLKFATKRMSGGV